MNNTHSSHRMWKGTTITRTLHYKTGLSVRLSSVRNVKLHSAWYWQVKERVCKTWHRIYSKGFEIWPCTKRRRSKRSALAIRRRRIDQYAAPFDVIFCLSLWASQSTSEYARHIAYVRDDSYERKRRFPKFPAAQTSKFEQEASDLNKNK